MPPARRPRYSCSGVDCYPGLMPPVRRPRYSCSGVACYLAQMPLVRRPCYSCSGVDCYPALMPPVRRFIFFLWISIFVSSTSHSGVIIVIILYIAMLNIYSGWLGVGYTSVIKFKQQSTQKKKKQYTIAESLHLFIQTKFFISTYIQCRSELPVKNILSSLTFS